MSDFGSRTLAGQELMRSIAGEKKSVTIPDIARDNGWSQKSTYDGFHFTKDGRSLSVRTFVGTSYPTSAILHEGHNRSGVWLPPEEIKRVLQGEACVCDTYQKHPEDVVLAPECPLVHWERP